MDIRTGTAIVPFQGMIQPARSVDYRIMRYSEGEKHVQDEFDYLDYDSGQSAVVYDRSGKGSSGGKTLGKNIDLYI